jgi:hypothetical protein
LKSAELTTPAGASTQTFDLPSGGRCNTNKHCPDGGSAQGQSNVSGGAGQGGHLKGDSLSSSQ